jgi:hypothetical protein
VDVGKHSTCLLLHHQIVHQFSGWCKDKAFILKSLACLTFIYSKRSKHLLSRSKNNRNTTNNVPLNTRYSICSVSQCCLCLGHYHRYRYQHPEHYYFFTSHHRAYLHLPINHSNRRFRLPSSTQQLYNRGVHNRGTGYSTVYLPQQSSHDHVLRDNLPYGLPDHYVYFTDSMCYITAIFIAYFLLKLWVFVLH